MGKLSHTVNVVLYLRCKIPDELFWNLGQHKVLLGC